MASAALSGRRRRRDFLGSEALRQAICTRICARWSAPRAADSALRSCLREHRVHLTAHFTHNKSKTWRLAGLCTAARPIDLLSSFQTLSIACCDVQGAFGSARRGYAALTATILTAAGPHISDPGMLYWLWTTGTCVCRAALRQHVDEQLLDSCLNRGSRPLLGGCSISTLCRAVISPHRVLF